MAFGDLPVLVALHLLDTRPANPTATLEHHLAKAHAADPGRSNRANRRASLKHEPRDVDLREAAAAPRAPFR